MAELIAAYSPPMPKPVRKRQAKNHHGSNEIAVSAVADEVDGRGDEEQLLAAEAIGQPAEEQRADAGAGDVERRRQARDLRRRESASPLPGSAIRPPTLPTIVTSSPSRIQTVPEADDDQPVPARPRQPVQPGGDRVSTVPVWTLPLLTPGFFPCGRCRKRRPDGTRGSLEGSGPGGVPQGMNALRTSCAAAATLAAAVLVPRPPTDAASTVSVKLSDFKVTPSKASAAHGR